MPHPDHRRIPRIGRRALAAAVQLAAVIACAPAAGAQPAWPPAGLLAPVLSVRGHDLVSQGGTSIRLTGVNRSGAEYACAEGWGIWDGPTDTDRAIRAMARWHVNA